MPAVNNKSSIESRRFICGGTVELVKQFLVDIDEADVFATAIALACVANSPTGEADKDEMTRTFDWFNNAIRRLTVLVDFLQGRCSVTVDENGRCQIAMSSLMEQLIKDNGDDVNIAMKKLETESGWLGLVASSEADDGDEET